MQDKAQSLLVLSADQGFLGRSSDYLAGQNIEVTWCQDLAEALADPAASDLLLFDLAWPTLSAGQVLETICLWFEESTLLAVGDADNPPSEKIFSFLRRYCSSTEFLAQLDRARAYHREITEVRALQQKNRETFQNRLEWLLWKKSRDSRQLIDYGARMVSNLRHALFQGEGVGGLVSQAEFLSILPRQSDGSCCIPAGMADELQKNARLVRTWLGALERFVSLESKKFSPEDRTTDDLLLCLSRARADVQRFQSIGNHQIVQESFPFEVCGLSFNPAGMELALREVLTNAFKYSPEESTINITFFSMNQYLSIAVINAIAELPQMASWQEEVMLPFARLSNVFDERFLDEELGLGTGLSVIQDVLMEGGGNIFIRPVMDHSREKGCIMAEILIPQRQEKHVSKESLAHAAQSP